MKQAEPRRQPPPKGKRGKGGAVKEAEVASFLLTLKNGSSTETAGTDVPVTANADDSNRYTGPPHLTVPPHPHHHGMNAHYHCYGYPQAPYGYDLPPQQMERPPYPPQQQQQEAVVSRTSSLSSCNDSIVWENLLSNSPLVFMKDRDLVPDALFVAMGQMKPCRLTVADRVGCYKSRDLGFIGFCW